ncbi:MAG: VTC domain-containing protein [Deltaproteobacteria bacterium]|nr:VTC domain-containing protein [Deltaproteobacteria bacterium]
MARTQRDARPATEREQKFVVGERGVAELLRAIAGRARPVLWDLDRPIAWARTTYLDTEDLRLFRSRADRVARRLRVREYASARSIGDPPVLTGACALELKESIGDLRAKVRFFGGPERIWRLARLGVCDGMDGDDPELRAIARHLGDADLAPRVTTLYRRVSFTAEDGCVRITIDHDLGYYRPPQGGAAGDPAEPPEPVGSCAAKILEVKTSTELPAWLRDALRGLKEAEGFSKFELATLASTLTTAAAVVPIRAAGRHALQSVADGRSR